MPELPCSRVLRLRRESQKRVGLSFCEHLHRRVEVVRLDPLDVLARINTHIGEHAGYVRVLCRTKGTDRNSLTFEVADCTDTLVAEKLITPSMHARQYD